MQKMEKLMIKYISFVVLINLLFFCKSFANDVNKDSSLKHRMGTLIIKTTPGAEVTVKQLAHEFCFGTAISSRILTEDISPTDKKKYLAILKENFNSAVHENAMKWGVNETKQGEVTYHDADVLLKWCTDNNLKMRGHCVFWEADYFVQDWIKKIDDHTLPETLKRRAIDLLTHYRNKISEFDVNNEMLHNNYFSSRLGESIRKEMFLWCKNANPDSILYVNDFDIFTGNYLDQYEEQIKSLITQGTPIGGIGIQGHFENNVSPKLIKYCLDRLSHFNLPIKITEFDIKTLDEDAKAKGLENLYRIAFEHPSVEGIYMWGFWSECHWLSSEQWGIKGYTALWDKNWKPTSAAKKYRELVFNEWWTDYKGKANENGLCEIKVFFGRHRITINDKTSSVVFISKNKGIERINLTLQ